MCKLNKEVDNLIILKRFKLSSCFITSWITLRIRANNVYQTWLQINDDWGINYGFTRWTNQKHSWKKCMPGFSWREGFAFAFIMTWFGSLLTSITTVTFPSPITCTAFIWTLEIWLSLSQMSLTSPTHDTINEINMLETS